MDIITTSLEALIQRATNVHNQGPDTAAIDAFCGLINKEPECTQAASKFIIAKAHSLKEWEALQALLVLENCMKKCGIWFHSEVGKFRFLNELIKLVSPKYLGAHTPESVKRRVLELMASWSTAFPNQSKIKEAYVMLKKQGVVQDSAPPAVPEPSPSPPTIEPRERTSSIFQDEEKSLLLQKLLRSSNPVDLQAANRLIKTMVKEDEKRVEEKWRRRVELETVVNNCLLLREMLSSYENGTSSLQDVELINELHTTCTNLRPVLIRLANNPDPAFTCDVLSANDELGEVLAKYKEVMSSRVIPAAQQSALLDLTSPERPTPPSTNNPIQGGGLGLIQGSSSPIPTSTTVAEPQTSSLDDILGLIPSATSSIAPSIPQSSHISKNIEVVPPAKPKGLQELDLLGENMLKEILSNSGQQQASKRNSSKISMNELLSNGASHNSGDKASGSELVNDSEPDDLLGRLSPAVSSDSGYAASTNNSTLQGTTSLTQSEAVLKNDEPLLSLGDIDSALESLGLNDPTATQPNLVTVNQSTSNQLQTDASLLSTTTAESERTVQLQDNDSDDVILLGSPAISQQQDSPQTPASLSDVSVSIDSIKPSGVPPWMALSDPEGVTIVVTLASDRPRPDVSVFVITTTSKSKQALSDFELRPIVPKRCKARLLVPSATALPPFNPFLPPAAIVQILLIASYSKEPINLKLVINYAIDEETVTDIGQIDQLRLAE